MGPDRSRPWYADLLSDDTGVSPVVGGVFMLSTLVVLSSVAGTAVAPMLGPEAPPTESEWTVTHDESGTMMVEYERGPALRADRLRLVVGQGPPDDPVPVRPSDRGYFAASVAVSAPAFGGTVPVRGYDGSTIESGDHVVFGEATGVPAIEPSDRVRVVWVGADGSRSHVLASAAPG